MCTWYIIIIHCYLTLGCVWQSHEALLLSHCAIRVRWHQVNHILFVFISLNLSLTEKCSESKNMLMLLKHDGCHSSDKYRYWTFHLFRSMGHTNRRHTATLKVPYYVGDHFTEEYKGMNLKNIEQSVEEDYISNLRNNCWKEKQQSKWRIRSYLIMHVYRWCIKRCFTVPGCPHNANVI